MKEKSGFFDLTIEDICLLLCTVLFGLFEPFSGNKSDFLKICNIVLIFVVNIVYCIVILCRHEFKSLSFLLRIFIIGAFNAILGFIVVLYLNTTDLENVLYPFIIGLSCIPMMLTSMIIILLKRIKSLKEK